MKEPVAGLVAGAIAVTAGSCARIATYAGAEAAPVTSNQECAAAGHRQGRDCPKPGESIAWFIRKAHQRHSPRVSQNSPYNQRTRTDDRTSE